MAILQIKCRFSGVVRFEGEFGLMKLCAEAAVNSGADLLGANLLGANLSRADLSRADLSRADLLGANLNSLKVTSLARRATRSDGYEFFLWRTDAGFRVKAGCRFFTMDEAWRHWEETRGGSPLGDESHDILTMFELHIKRVEAG